MHTPDNDSDSPVAMDIDDDGDKDWGELRPIDAPLGLDEMDHAVEQDRKHEVDRVERSWERHRITLQSNLERCGVTAEIARNAAFGNSTMCGALAYIGDTDEDVQCSYPPKQYKSLNWRDADFWRVATPWARLSRTDPSAASPPELLFLLQGTRRDAELRLRNAIKMEHPAQVEFLVAHGVPMPFGCVRPFVVGVAYHSGVCRYRINVTLIRSAMQVHYPDVITSLIMGFLSPKNAWRVTSHGDCLCMHCVRV